MKTEDIAPAISAHDRRKMFPGQELVVGESDGLRSTIDELARMKRDLRKAERARLRGVFTPNQGGPNRKARRAKRA
jgi:hypothetical protein